MIFHGSLLIDLANASWTTLKFFRQRIAKKDFLTVGQNNLLAESDRFTYGARIHNRCDLHARTKRGPAVSQSSQLADIALFDCPSRDLSFVILHIQKRWRYADCATELPSQFPLMRDRSSRMLRPC